MDFCEKVCGQREGILTSPLIVAIHFGYRGHLTGIIIFKHGFMLLLKVNIIGYNFA